MNPVFKVLILFTFFLFMSLAAYKAYIYFNNKITGSKNGWQLLLFSFLLILINIIIYFGGLWALIKVYTFL
ncbi:MAG TPA: hypothetical protein VM888_06930 [Chitinophagaceae bacterium]|nr:hypothetical protein [Chitinophagaceae bacterium]